MKLLREEENKDVFVEIFKNEVAQFRAHVNRIKNQYTLKDNLKPSLIPEETKMLMLNCQSILTKKTLVLLFIQRITKFTSVKF